jgi:hypothetical protein
LATSFHLDLIPLLLSHARHRRAGDPTPDAFTLLAKLARHVPSALAPYWRWGLRKANLGAAAISQLVSECITAPVAMVPAPVATAMTSATAAAPGAAQTPTFVPDFLTKLLALKLIEEWSKPSSATIGASSGAVSTTGGSSSAAPASASVGGDDDEEEGLGSFEPAAPAEGGFYTLEGSADLLTNELLNMYADLRQRFNEAAATKVAQTAAVAAGAPPPSLAALHAIKQASVAAGSVRAKVLTCLALLPHDRWKSLSPAQRVLLRTVALQAAEDEVTTVRAAACRSLCLMLLYAAREVSANDVAEAAQTNEEDPSSIEAGVAAQDALAFTRCATARLLGLLDPARSPVIIVRIKAAWSLANLADFGISSSSAASAADSGTTSDSSQQPQLPSQAHKPSCLPVHQLLPSSLYMQLVERVLSATGDNEKILSNAVRGLGNLARGFPLNITTGAVPAVPIAAAATSVLFLRMLSTLLSSLFSSRHALGNAFRNPALPALWRSDAQAELIARKVFVQLLSVVRDAPVLVDNNGDNINNKSVPSGGVAATGASKLSNFKVRIHAASALSAPPSRAHYGSSFALVLRTLLSLCESLLVSSSIPSSSSSSSSSAATAAAEDASSSFQDFKYREQLRLQVLATLITVLGLESGGKQTGAAAAAAAVGVEVDVELGEIYLSNVALLARLVLAERLRWEKEKKELDRIVAGATRPRLVARGATAVPRSTITASNPASAAAAAALRVSAVTTSGMSRHAIEQATGAVERAAASIEAVLRSLEQQGSGPQQLERAGLAARFASAANGEQPVGSAGIDAGQPVHSPPRMAFGH